MLGAVHEVIKPVNFGEYWLWGFRVARGRHLGFSIDLRRRHYNTLVLPCMRLCDYSAFVNC